jgi:hypothetical protein
MATMLTEPPYWDLWDLDSNNRYGDYLSQDAALAALRAGIAAHGLDAYRNMSMAGWGTPALEQQPAISKDALIALALGEG